MNTVILEDNQMDALMMQQLCISDSEVRLMGTYDTAAGILDHVSKEKIDLLFLDVEVPDMSGLELIEKLPYQPLIIVTTSNKAYASDAFDYDVTDFLVKPLITKRFKKAISKATQGFEKRNKIALSSAASELYVRADGKLIRIPYDDILYFENVGDYIKVITNDKVHIIHGALKTLAEKLGHPRFLKVHRSFIVNLDKVIDIEDCSIQISKKMIPISRAHKSIVMNSINLI